MNIPWGDERCIRCALTLTDRSARCARTALLTREHIIPEAIGGRLTCDFLCNDCNSALGQIEASIKENSSIWLAIDNLKASLPGVWLTMAENKSCIAEGPSGKAEGRIKDGEFSVNSLLRPDGSLIQRTPDCEAAVAKMLKRRGTTQNEIASARQTLREIPDDVRVKVADGIEVLKSTITNVHPVLLPTDVEPRVLLKIAYEHLALHLGRSIFHQYFDPVRSALATAGTMPTSCSFEQSRLRSREYQPTHGLAVKKAHNGLIVKICLFGYLVYKVKFLEVTTTAPLCCYALRLDSGQEDWKEI